MKNKEILTERIAFRTSITRRNKIIDLSNSRIETMSTTMNKAIDAYLKNGGKDD